MNTKFVVIGGGIAGLCAAIRLAELGEEPLLIEGGAYPSHKICGEFLSPECIGYLENWNIHPVAISQAIFRTPNSSLTFPFPSPAGGLSHVRLDPELAQYASACGVTLKTNTQVNSFQPKKNSKEPHLIQLSNNATLEATHVIIATGRFLNYLTKEPLKAYMGFKAHFDKLPLEAGTMEMFSFPGAYLGISPIEESKYNVACLAELKTVNNKDPCHFMQSLIAQHPDLQALMAQGHNLFENWMVASLPAFGIKQTPNWLDTYFIGDAAVTIPPACGNGLSMAIVGGRLAAEYSLRQHDHEFKAVWTKRCSSQLFWAQALHQVMLNPTFSKSLMHLTHYFPYLGKIAFALTRHSSGIL